MKMDLVLLVNRMTYGEAHTYIKKFIHMEAGVFQTIPLPSCEPQMNKEDAAIYYSEKCRKTFLDLGFKYEVFGVFEKRLEISFSKIRSNTNAMLKREVQNIILSL